MNPFHVVLLSSTLKEYTPYEVLSINDVTPNSLHWLDIHNSSDWSDLLTLSKNYFVLYATVHDSGPGGIWWGEMDDLEFNGFVERGKIKDGYQAETPTLVRKDDKIYLFYHTDNEPGNLPSAIQQTRLITTLGGSELHACTWEDKGRPLGVLPGENHTGYLSIVKRGVNDYLGYHLAIGGTNSLARYSVSSDLENWVRDGDISRTGAVEPGGNLQPLNTRPFLYNNRKYAFGKYKDSEYIDWIVLIGLDNNYKPLYFLERVYRFDNLNNVCLFIQGDFAYVYFSTADVAPTEPYYLIKYDLRFLV